jgi:ribosomal protein L37AE/L43A
MVNVKEILSAWAISVNPTEEQAKKAAYRLSVCDGCENKLKNRFGVFVCIECGCVLSKKAFSPLENPCPLRKWDQE